MLRVSGPGCVYTLEQRQVALLTPRDDARLSRPSSLVEDDARPATRGGAR